MPAVSPEITVKSTLTPAHTSEAEAVIWLSCIEILTASLSLLSQPSIVWDEYTTWLSVNAIEESNKLPPVAASYHWMFCPVAVKSATVATSQNVCSVSPVGVAGPLFIKLNDSVIKQVSVIASSTLIYMIVLSSLVGKFVTLLIIGFKSFSASWMDKWYEILNSFGFWEPKISVSFSVKSKLDAAESQLTKSILL